MSAPVPRRTTPDALALAVGRRIKELREEAGLTLEGLAYQSELGSKGHLSSIERGLVRPTVHTLHALAQALDLAMLDLVTFPDEDDRQALVDATRFMSPPQVQATLRYARRTGGRPALEAAEEKPDYGKRRR